MRKSLVLAIFLFSLIVSGVQAVTIDKEENVPAYTVPALLVSENGTTIRTKSDWEKIRRPELLKLFQEEMYGFVPKNKNVKISFLLKSTDKKALNGLATRKEVTIRLSNGDRVMEVPMLIYLPNSSKKPVPVFVSMNFSGNYTVNADPGITIKADPKDLNPERGSWASRWEVEEVLKRGYGLITTCYLDFEPDSKDGFKDGVRSLFYDSEQKPDSSSWGAISGWAWGLSRMLDYAETDKDINAKQAIVLGHSRLGKVAVWAGASDPRFAIVISNNSGAGGAALSKRIFGQTVADANRSFPHWFCDHFKKYSNNESAMTFDQHELLALVAPRPLYVASAEEDLWADPQGEYLSALYATPAYQLYKKEGLSGSRPLVNQSVMNTIGYHIRTGKHDIVLFDWEKYMDFADLHFKRKK